MGGAYPYMDLNAKYGKLLLRCLRQSIQIRISPKWGKCMCNSNLYTKCRTERRFHAFKFSDGYKSTMDWCSIYLTPQALPKYIYLSPTLIFPTTSTEKNTPYESLQALLHYVEWELEQKRTGQWGLHYRIYVHSKVSMVHCQAFRITWHSPTRKRHPLSVNCDCMLYSL